MIVLLGSLQKSGSLWLLNMLNDLIVATGGSDMSEVRRRFRLGWFVRPSGHVSLLRIHRVLHLLLPALLGETFIINTHAPPGWSLRQAIRFGWVRPIYVYRDPRDVALSLYEHSQDLRQRGIDSSTTFDELDSMEKAIRFAASRLPQWRSWMTIPGLSTCRYEELLADPAGVVKGIVRYLGLAVSEEAIDSVVGAYDSSRVGRRVKGQRAMHFNVGRSGRWLQVMTAEQIALCEELFAEDLSEMGYPAVAAENPQSEDTSREPGFNPASDRDRADGRDNPVSAQGQT